MANSVGDIVERITQYIQVKTEQVKLKIIGTIARVLANIIAMAVIAVMGFFFVLFISYAAASYLNALLGSVFLGHLLVAAFYLILIIVIVLLTKTRKIQGWFENLILTIADQDEQED